MYTLSNPSCRWARYRAAAIWLSALLAGSCADTPVVPDPPIADPPSISCPSSFSAVALDGRPMAVAYVSPVVTGGVAPVTVSCAPASGSTFAIGTTPVTCTATDARQRASTCGFAVAVTLPPQIAATRFAAFGDSITQGNDGQNLVTSTFNGRLLFHNNLVLFGSEYPTVLQQMLKSRYATQACVINVTNLGRQGEPASEADSIRRFQNEVLGRGYQGVLIMEGSNDTYQAYYAGSPSASTALLHTAASNIRTMIQIARGAGLRPYLATLPPQNRNACIPICRGYGQDLVPEYNALIHGIAAAEGVPLVDVFAAFNGDLSLLAQDGLHPNASGFERIANTFFDAIKNTIELATPGPPACN